MTGADRRHDEELQHRVGKPYSPTVHMFGIVWVCLGMFSDGKELKVCHGCTANTAPKCLQVIMVDMQCCGVIAGLIFPPAGVRPNP